MTYFTIIIQKWNNTEITYSSCCSMLHKKYNELLKGKNSCVRIQLTKEKRITNNCEVILLKENNYFEKWNIIIY